MDFYINIILSKINKELIFGVMRDFRIGGLNPTNYDLFIRRVKALIRLFNEEDSSSNSIYDFMTFVEPSAEINYRIFLIKNNLSEFNLTDINEVEASRIWERVNKIVKDKTMFCWHPEASISKCTTDNYGKVKISSAHSIQRNKILSSISENNTIKQFKINRTDKNPNQLIKFASTFYGFCDKHDKIFNPIEKKVYLGDEEQNFLFAYRASVHSFHIKLVFNEFYDFGTQAIKDIESTKKIFNDSIINGDYSRIVTDVLELENEYPIAVASASDLDYDFKGNEIKHSETRMENFYLTVFPQNKKTFVLFSYFLDDAPLYGNIIKQIRNGGKIKSDLSVLIAGHCENVFFNPSYYNKYIKNQETNIGKLFKQTQFDFVPYDGLGKETKPISLTPDNYLNNKFNIQLFHNV